MQLSIEPGQSVTVPLPPQDRAFLYALSGHVLVGTASEPLAAGEVAWSDPVAGEGSTLEIRAPEGDDMVRIVLFSGQPIRESVVAYGPFVMNTKAEIEQAYRDFRDGRFGPVPIMARL
jgi:redox-sensitive bicupin YhaK (pirin superfamily)